MEIQDPYGLFEVNGDNIRLRNGCSNLEDLTERIIREKEDCEILKIEKDDVHISINITQEFSEPKKYDIKGTNKEVVERVFGRIAKKLKVEGCYVYYTAPLYSVSANFIIKNTKEKIDNKTLCEDMSSLLIKKGIYNEPCSIRKGQINYIRLNELDHLMNNRFDKEKYTVLIGEDNLIYIYKPSELIFVNQEKEEKGIPLEQCFSGEEKAKFSETIDLLKKLDILKDDNIVGLVDNFYRIEPIDSNSFKIKDIPIIQLEDFTYLVPQLVQPKLGLKYLTNQYYLINCIDTKDIKNRIENVTSIIPIFLNYTNILQSKRKINKLDNIKIKKPEIKEDNFSALGTVLSFNKIISDIPSDFIV